MIYTSRNKLPVEIIDGDLKSGLATWKYEDGAIMHGKIEKLKADGGIEEINRAVIIAFLTAKKKEKAMKINTCAECKRWSDAISRYNKGLGWTKEECNRYGICNKIHETVEWDNCGCAHFRKSLKLSIIQWLYRHGIKVFR